MACSQGQLVLQPWTSVTVSSRQFLVKGIFGEVEEGEGYEVLMWEVNEGVMWQEKLVEEELADRMTLLNPNVEAPKSLVLSHLSSLFLSSLTSLDQTDVETREGITLVINGSISCLPFTWNFHCSQAPEYEIQRHLIQPLLSCLSVLHHQQKSLMETIRKKDREIQDYKDGGAVLSRRYVETAVFNEEDFTSATTRSQDLENSVKNFAEILVEERFKTLYQSIGNVAVKVTEELKDDDDEGDYVSTGTNPLSDSHPVTASSHPPPCKQLALDQDEELGRRKALERKLDEERVRGKKKKKRLM